MAMYLLLLAQLVLTFGSTHGSNVYIVYMGKKDAGIQPDLVKETHHGVLASVLGSSKEAKGSIIYSYKHGFSGFAAVLSPSQAARLADVPEVVRVLPNRILNLHTTRSWDFMHLNPSVPYGLLSTTKSGQSSIIGILDTGIWPESESFRDDNMGEIPSRWKGKCIEGEKFTKSNCNRKIIGAKWYIKGYEAENGKLNKSTTIEFLSSRDATGHGTHTASTAAGSPVTNASFLNLASGIARGGASRAHLAVYKVCWATGDCSAADILAAFDDAIHDGVDVISVSLGQSPPLPAYVDDALAVGSFHAAAKGITVVCSGGNSGPFPETVINAAPWVVTVGASTIDRTFLSRIVLGNNLSLVGESLFTGKYQDKLFKIVSAEDIAASDASEDDARSCNKGSLNTSLARGNVVLCFQTRTQRMASVATDTVKSSQGVGVIFAQSLTKDTAFSFDIPCVQVDFEAGTSILSYIGTTKNPLVKFTSIRTVVGKLMAPEVAYFSSRGPSSLSPFVLKPDVVAPGVNILASWSPVLPLSITTGPVQFNIESGTSMACPHVSAIVALLKSAHPSWSPAAVKSALVTTAYTKDDYGFDMVAEGAPYKLANPFDYGGGHVDPNKAVDPGLIFDSGLPDYIDFLCLMGYNNSAVSLMSGHQTDCQNLHKSPQNLNLPSIMIPKLRKRITVARTVTNVGPPISIYKSRIEAPQGVAVSVKPEVLVFNSSITKLNFKVVFHPKLKVQGRYTFGNLFWEDGIHFVKIPLAVRIVVDDFYVDA
ncbi:Subtilisin-like protease SBT3.6 [Rhynchospora pubera]|uniref:Subtilisin-like protease SBT3.6 n=1 Tax=Rhynchospora pubera TaxID=906938 RepID=A0AAV8E6E8_9POAL|nr:Subtilisin-like protease SBT3.6 [Rhynchospora pubera]